MFKRRIAQCEIHLLGLETIFILGFRLDFYAGATMNRPVNNPSNLDHFRGTRRSILTLICGVAIGFAASSDTPLLLGVAWLFAAFAYAEKSYLDEQYSRAIGLWTLGVAGLAGTLLVQQQYLAGAILGALAAGYALQAWRERAQV